MKDPLPTSGGLYRVWIAGDTLYSYYGQSKNLRQRALQADHCYDDTMPFTDPHTASPAFWACLQDYPGLKLNVAVAPFESSAFWRQGIEDFLLAYHRWQFGRSPRWNYSRMPRNWTRPSEKRRGMRGEATEAYLPCHHPGIAPPITDLFEESDPTDLQWAGHGWSDWRLARDAVKGSDKAAHGLYRLRKKNAQALYFIGGGFFANALREAASYEADLEFSAVRGDYWEVHQLRELRTDCLGLYLRQTHSLPSAQYGGEEKDAESLLPRLQEKAHWLLSLLDPVPVFSRQYRLPLPV